MSDTEERPAKYGPIPMKGRYTPEQIDSIIAACPSGLPEALFHFQNTNFEHEQIVDRRQALKRALEDAAASYSMHTTWLTRYKRPAPSHQRKRLSSIHQAAQRLLGALGVAANGDPEEIPKEIRSVLLDQAEEMARQIGEFPNHPSKLVETGEEIYVEHYCDKQLRDMVEGIVMLRSWAAEAAAVEAEQVGLSARANTGDAAFRGLMKSLGEIWENIFDQEIKTSVGKPGSKLEGKATGPLILFIQTCLNPLEIEKTDEAVRDQVRVIFQGKGKSDQEKPDPPITTTP